MQALLLMLHVLTAVALVALVLVQHGKGADAGAAFGSGASNTMFGSAGSTPFLVKITACAAAIFFATSLTLSYLSSSHIRRPAQQRVIGTVSATTTAPIKIESGSVVPTTTDQLPTKPQSNSSGPK